MLTDTPMMPIDGSELEFVDAEATLSKRPDPNLELKVVLTLFIDEEDEEDDEFLFQPGYKPGDRGTNSDRDKADPVDEPISKALMSYFRSSGLKIPEYDGDAGMLIIRGPLHVFEAAFGITLFLMMFEGKELRVYQGPVYLPAPFLDVIDGVSGLASIPLSDRRPYG